MRFRNVFASYHNIFMGFLIVALIYPVIFELLDPGLIRFVGKSVCILILTVCVYIFFLKTKGQLLLPKDIFKTLLLEVTVFFMMVVLQAIFNKSNVCFFIKQFIFLFNFQCIIWYAKTRYRYSKRSSLKSLNCIFYIIFSMLVLFNFLVADNQNGEMIFRSIGDKNYTAILMFIYFMYCFHFRCKLGLIMCSYYYLFCNSSRSSILLFLTFFLCILFRNLIFKIIHKIKLDKTVRLFFLLAVFIMSFSFFWVQSISTHDLQPYRQGLNDESNKMRFTANIHAANMIEQEPRLLLFGYGEDLKAKMNIDNDNYSKHPVINGVRLVQPHNSIINFALVIGILPCIIFLYILGGTIDLIYDKSTIEFIYPYIFNAMFMHSLLNGSFLGLWLMVSCLIAIDIQGKIINET